jgi:diguanylate cyclase (GGDEF)-like protein
LAGEEFAFADPGLARTVSRLLDGLQRNLEDDDLYSLVYGGLKRFTREGPIDGRYVTWVNDQLTRYAKDPIALPRLRIKARLVQQHIAVFLPGGLDAIEPAPTPAPATAPAENLTERRARYDELKRSEQDAWRAVYDTVTDFSKLKELWVSSLDNLARERDQLAGQLAETTERLQRIENEAQSLRTELTELREATERRPAVRALPKSAGRPPRRALTRREHFLRQLEAEVERVRRHGNPLAVALLDVDQLGNIERAHGAQAAEAVRRCYSTDILSGFRAYDIVARYQDDAYAVLFPNTAREGAIRALEKARKRAAESHFTYDGASLPLPGFAGGLAFYSAGEETAALLARANEGLRQAHSRGEPLVVL